MLLREVLITVVSHLLLLSGETNGKVLDLLTGVKGEVLPVLAQPLQRRPADMVDVDARCSDGVPHFLAETCR